MAGVMGRPFSSSSVAIHESVGIQDNGSHRLWRHGRTSLSRFGRRRSLAIARLRGHAVDLTQGGGPESHSKYFRTERPHAPGGRPAIRKSPRIFSWILSLVAVV